MIKLDILTPEKSLYSGEIRQVVVPTQDGVITILPDHVPLISLLKAGEVLINDGRNTIPLVVSSGFIELHEGSIKILADTAERITELDEERAREAQQRAKDALNDEQLDAHDHAYFAAKLQKELARVKAIEKYGR